MNVREFQAVLADVNKTDDIRDCVVWAYDADFKGLAPVTGIEWNSKMKSLIIKTDEL